MILVSCIIAVQSVAVTLSLRQNLMVKPLVFLVQRRQLE